MSRTEEEQMYHHGTLHWRPTPSVLYSAAVSDLIKLRANAKIRVDRSKAQDSGAAPKHQGRTSSTAFLYKHVCSGSRPSDVLRAAIAGIKDGQKAKAIKSRYLYESLAILHAALEIATTKGQ